MRTYSTLGPGDPVSQTKIDFHILPGLSDKNLKIFTFFRPTRFHKNLKINGILDIFLKKVKYQYSIDKNRYIYRLNRTSENRKSCEWLW
jgi:hypothetical protein